MEDALYAAEERIVQLLGDAAALSAGTQEPEAEARALSQRVVQLQREMHRLIDATPRADFVPRHTALHDRYS